jgi:hypothetical protein
MPRMNGLSLIGLLLSYIILNINGYPVLRFSRYYYYYYYLLT